LHIPHKIRTKNSNLKQGGEDSNLMVEVEVEERKKIFFNLKVLPESATGECYRRVLPEWMKAIARATGKCYRKAYHSKCYGLYRWKKVVLLVCTAYKTLSY